MRQSGRTTLDRALILWLNHFVGRSAFFDRTVVWMNASDFVRGGLMVCVYWWALFRRRSSSAIAPAVPNHQRAFVLLPGGAGPGSCQGAGPFSSVSDPSPPCFID